MGVVVGVFVLPGGAGHVLTREKEKASKHSTVQPPCTHCPHPLARPRAVTKEATNELLLGEVCSEGCVCTGRLGSPCPCRQAPAGSSRHLLNCLW